MVGEADYLEQLAPNKDEFHRQDLDFFRRVLERALLKYYLMEFSTPVEGCIAINENGKDRYLHVENLPKSSDYISVGIDGVFVNSYSSGGFEIGFASKAIARNIKDDCSKCLGDAGLVLRGCIAISWDICKHITWSVGEEKMTEFLFTYKKFAMGGMEYIHAQEVFDSLSYALSNASADFSHFLDKDEQNRRNNMQQHLRRAMGVGCIWPFILVGTILFFVFR